MGQWGKKHVSMMLTPGGTHSLPFLKPQNTGYRRHWRSKFDSWQPYGEFLLSAVEGGEVWCRSQKTLNKNMTTESRLQH